MFGGSKGTGTGFTFGSLPTTTTDAAGSTQATTKPLFSFGNTTTMSTTTANAQSSGFSFGTTSKPLFSGATLSVASSANAASGFSFGPTTSAGTGSIFGSAFSPSITSTSATGFTFGSKPVGVSGNLFGTSTTTSSSATTTTTSATQANTTASLFSSSAGFGAKPNSLFGNFITSSSTTTASTNTTNAQLGCGSLLFGTTPTTGFGSSVTATTATISSAAPFCFGSAISSNQPTASLCGFGTLQPIANSATSAISSETTNIPGQKPASGLFAQVATTAASTIATLFGIPTTAKSTFGFSTAIGTTTPTTTPTTIITTVAAPSPCFDSSTTVPMAETAAPTLFGSPKPLLAAATTTSIAFGTNTSVATPSFVGLFGTKTTTVVTSVPMVTVTSISGLNDSTIPTLTSSSAITTTTTAITTTTTALSFGATVPSSESAANVAALTSAPSASFCFGSPAPVTTTALSLTQPVASVTSTVAPVPSFGITPTATASVSTGMPTGFAFGQLSVTTASTTISTAALPVMASFLSSTTSSAGLAATVTVTSADSTLSSLLYPSKTSAAALPATASISAVTTVTVSSALASAVPAATAITPDKSITFSQLEQLVNRLTLDVEAQQRVFMSQVLELNAYDRVLRENQQKVLDVSEEIKQLEEEKDRFLHTVDFISQQQTELEALVVDLEKALGLSDWTEMAPIGLPDPGVATHADMQRQALLQLQLQIDAQLKQADDDINDIIEQVKELQRTTVGTDDQAETADQIAQILRRQLDALQWIDEQSCDLKKKVTKLSKGLSSR